MLRDRRLRVAATLAVTGLALAYILSRIDIGETAHVIAHADPAWLAAGAILTVITVPPQAYRWQKLLAVRGIHERVGWLCRTYFVAYAVGQVLPTGLGGDASRIFETTRRHAGMGSPVAGSVLLERAIGGAVTLVLAAAGFALAVGRYSIGAYLWIEGAFVLATVAAGIVLFSASLRRHLRRAVPLLRRLRLERPVRAAYEGVHAYRYHPRTLIPVVAITFAAQASRIVAIWASGRSVGVDVSLRPYIVLGPLLFLVMLVPFTVNGLAVREAFFVSFLGGLGVGANRAFATGFLFFVMTLLLAAPGLVIVVWESVRRTPRPIVDV